MSWAAWLAVCLSLLCAGRSSRAILVVPPRPDGVDFGAPGGGLHNNQSSAMSDALVYNSVPATFGLEFVEKKWYEVNLVLPPPDDPNLCDWNRTLIEKAFFFGRGNRRTAAEEEANVARVRMRTEGGEVQVERAPVTNSLRGRRRREQEEEESQEEHRQLSFGRLDSSIPVAILAKRGGCYFFEKGMTAMNLRRQFPKLRSGKRSVDIQFVVVYNDFDPEKGEQDRLFEMGPPEQEIVAFDVSMPIDLRLVSIKNEAGLGLLSAIERVANATYDHGGDDPQPQLPYITNFDTPTSPLKQHWSFLINIEATKAEREEAEPFTPGAPNDSGQINGKDQDGQNDERRYTALGILTRVCFALLIAIPILRNTISWHRGGGRIRVRRRGPGDRGYNSPFFSWIPRVYAVQPMVLDDNGNPMLPGSGEAPPRRRRGLLTEEQVLALPETEYDPKGDLLEKGEVKKPLLKTGSSRSVSTDDDDLSKDKKDDVSVSSSSSTSTSTSASKSKAPAVVHVEQALPLGRVDGMEQVRVEQESDDLEGDMHSSFEQSTCCSICLEDYCKGEKVRQLPRCKHTFHTSCILPWLTQRQGCCPLCKVPVLGQEVEDEDDDDDDVDEELYTPDVQARQTLGPRRVLLMDNGGIRTFVIEGSMGSAARDIRNDFRDDSDTNGRVITLDSLENGRGGVAPTVGRRRHGRMPARTRARNHTLVLPTVVDNEDEEDDGDVDDDATPVARGSYRPSYPHNDDADDDDATPVARGAGRRSLRRLDEEEDEDDDDSAYANEPSISARGGYIPPMLLVTTDKKHKDTSREAKAVSKASADQHKDTSRRHKVSDEPKHVSKGSADEKPGDSRHRAISKESGPTSKNDVQDDDDDEEDVYVPPRKAISAKYEERKRDDGAIPTSGEAAAKEDDLVAVADAVTETVAKDSNDLQPKSRDSQEASEENSQKEEQENEDAAASSPPDMQTVQADDDSVRVPPLGPVASTESSVEDESKES